jgi:hypothetical protein
MQVGGKKQDPTEFWGQVRMEENLRQVVNEMSAAEGGDGRDLLPKCSLKEDRGGLNEIEKTMRLEPLPGGGVEVVGRSCVGLPGTVADDEQFQGGIFACREKLESAWKWTRLLHSGAVSEGLKQRPLILLASGAEMIANLHLVSRKVLRNESFLEGQAQEDLIVAYDGVVEVGTNQKRSHGMRRKSVRYNGVFFQSA